jgi:hypothetical protein
MGCIASVAADISTDASTRKDAFTSLRSVRLFANFKLSHYSAVAIV